MLYSIDTNAISDTDRANIIADLFILQNEGKIEAVKVLEFLDVLQKETSPLVWDAALTGLMGVARKIQVTVPLFYVYKNYVLGLMDSMLRLMPSWQIVANDPFLTKIFKGSILLSAANLGHKPTIDNALQVFDVFKLGAPLSPDVRRGVFQVAVAAGNPSNYFWLLSRYQDSKQSAAEQIKCLQAIAKTQDPALILNTFKLAMDETQIRAQDAYILFVQASQGVTNSFIAWNFVKQNWDAILKKWEGKMTRIESILLEITKYFTTVDQLREFQEFFNVHPINGHTNSTIIKYCVDSVTKQLTWINTNTGPLQTWLQTKVPK